MICRFVPLSSKKTKVNSRGNDFDRLATVFIDQEQFKKKFRETSMKGKLKKHQALNSLVKFLPYLAKMNDVL